MDLSEASLLIYGNCNQVTNISCTRITYFDFNISAYNWNTKLLVHHTAIFWLMTHFFMCTLFLNDLFYASIIESSLFKGICTEITSQFASKSSKLQVTAVQIPFVWIYVALLLMNATPKWFCVTNIYIIHMWLAHSNFLLIVGLMYM